jgi:hypothetical protein
MVVIGLKTSAWVLTILRSGIIAMFAQQPDDRSFASNIFALSLLGLASVLPTMLCITSWFSNVVKTSIAGALVSVQLAVLGYAWRIVPFEI